MDIKVREFIRIDDKIFNVEDIKYVEKDRYYSSDVIKVYLKDNKEKVVFFNNKEKRDIEFERICNILEV